MGQEKGRSRSIGGAAFLLVILLALTACQRGSQTSSPSGSLEGRTLRVVYSSSASAIDVVAYKTMDLVRQRGVKVVEIFADGGAKAAQALLANQADVAANSLEDIVNGGLVAFGLARPRNLYAMVCKKDMDEVTDIKGRVLGAADPGSIANIFAEEIFKKHNIAKTDVRWVQIGGSSSRTAALIAGRVDCVFVYGEHVVRLRKEGFNTVTTISKEFAGMHDDMWASTKEWLSKNEDLALAIAQAQLAAAKWFNANESEWIAYAKQKVQGLDDDIAKESYVLLKEVDMYPEDGLMTEDSLRQTAQILVASGAIADKPISEWATVKYLEQARKM